MAAMVGSASAPLLAEGDHGVTVGASVASSSRSAGGGGGPPGAAGAADASGAGADGAVAFDTSQDATVHYGGPVHHGGRHAGGGGHMASTGSAKRGKRDNPGPGAYMWSDNVNLKKKPVWSMQSPDRRQLDLMLCTWTPASQSLQPRAPDPGEYGALDTAGRNGVFGAPKWSWERGSTRPCLAADPPKRLELSLNLPTYVHGQHPAKKMTPMWSCFGKDRKGLPANLGTWTPQMTTDLRPGPGTYDLDRVGKKWKAFTTRRGCQWGGRGSNLHPDVHGWVPKTKGSHGIPGGEISRLDIFPNKGSPKRRCGCKVCPGPCKCNDDQSPRSRATRGFLPRSMSAADFLAQAGGDEKTNEVAKDDAEEGTPA